MGKSVWLVVGVDYEDFTVDSAWSTLEGAEMRLSTIEAEYERLIKWYYTAPSERPVGNHMVCHYSWDVKEMSLDTIPANWVEVPEHE